MQLVIKYVILGLTKKIFDYFAAE